MTIQRRLLFICLTIVWMAVIFYMSSIPDLKSSLPSMIDLILRKIAHMAEYAILFLLLWKSFEGVKHRLLFAASISVIYAISDEFHQGFVHDRVASPIDVLIDSFGIGVGYLITKNLPSSAREV